MEICSRLKQCDFGFIKNENAVLIVLESKYHPARANCSLLQMHSWNNQEINFSYNLLQHTENGPFKYQMASH